MNEIDNRLIYINSADRLANESASRFNVMVPSFIINKVDQPNDYKIKVSVLKACIPYSFYNITNKNNMYRITESESDGSLQVSVLLAIPIGNYNAISFRQMIEINGMD